MLLFGFGLTLILTCSAHQQSSDHHDMASSNMIFDTRRMSRSPDSLLGDRDQRDHEGARYPYRPLDRNREIDTKIIKAGFTLAPVHHAHTAHGDTVPIHEAL